MLDDYEKVKEALRLIFKDDVPAGNKGK